MNTIASSPDREREASRERNRRYRERHREEIAAKWAERRASGQAAVYAAKQRSRIRFGGLREAVLERDGYKCVICAAPWMPGSREIVVHHIDHDRSHNVMDNLITMCRTCHPKVHGSDRPHVRRKISESLRRAWAEGRRTTT